MNREKLESMKGAELIVYADKLGVKVDCNKTRTQLKESKKNVIDRILAFEASQVKKEVVEIEEDKEAVTVDEVVETVIDTESKLSDEEYANIGLEITEQAKEKARKNKEDKTSITFDLNILSDMGLEFNINSRGSIIVKLKPANIEICVKKSKIVLYCRNNIISGVKVGCKFKKDNLDIESFKEVLDGIIQN